MARGTKGEQRPDDPAHLENVGEAGAIADHDVDETVRRLAQLGKTVFVPLFVRPSRDRFPRHADDPAEALKLFLSSYAFERQGRSPAYAELAVNALEICGAGPIIPARASSWAWSVWKKFCELGNFEGGEGANAKNNPLYPGRPADGRGVLSVAFSCALQADGYNLYRLAARAVASKDLRKAHDTLQLIRGIGPKIASLFLRDVALDRNLPEVDLGDRELLQPIDVWLRRVAERLTQRCFGKDDEEAAQHVVQLADNAGCCALSLNAGSWYFGAQVARTLQNLDEALKSPAIVKSLVEKHRARLGDEVQLLTQIDGEW
jgi:hypothetical protein